MSIYTALYRTDPLAMPSSPCIKYNPLHKPWMMLESIWINFWCFFELSWSLSKFYFDAWHRSSALRRVPEMNEIHPISSQVYTTPAPVILRNPKIDQGASIESMKLNSYLSQFLRRTSGKACQCVQPRTEFECNPRNIWTLKTKAETLQVPVV